MQGKEKFKGIVYNALGTKYKIDKKKFCDVREDTFKNVSVKDPNPSIIRIQKRVILLGMNILTR